MMLCGNDASARAIFMNFPETEVEICREGNNVSHSNRKTKRTFAANVQKVTYKKDGKVTTDYVCARCLKSDKVERV